MCNMAPRVFLANLDFRVTKRDIDAAVTTLGFRAPVAVKMNRKGRYGDCRFISAFVTVQSDDVVAQLAERMAGLHMPALSPRPLVAEVAVPRMCEMPAMIETDSYPLPQEAEPAFDFTVFRVWV